MEWSGVEWTVDDEYNAQLGSDLPARALDKVLSFTPSLWIREFLIGQIFIIMVLLSQCVAEGQSLPYALHIQSFVQMINPPT